MGNKFVYKNSQMRTNKNRETNDAFQMHLSTLHMLYSMHHFHEFAYS